VLTALQPVLDYIDANGVSYYVDMDNVQSTATSEEGYGDWPGADFLLSSSLYALLHLLLLCIYIYTYIRHVRKTRISDCRVFGTLPHFSHILAKCAYRIFFPHILAALTILCSNFSNADDLLLQEVE